MSAPVDSSKAGIKVSDTGERHIPASVRADGSTRKEIKIRPGYKPPEDVEVYKNRTAEAWKTRGSGGVPGAASVSDDAPSSRTNNKNAKRREARKKAKATSQDAESSTDNNVAPQASEEDASGETPTAVTKTDGPVGGEPQEPAESYLEKQSRSLRKKLRQAKDLKEKKESGESLLPEQLAKVIKINELIRQLESLGFDANGEPIVDS